MAADPALWEKTIHSEDRLRVIAKFTRAVTEQESGEIEYRIVHRDGDVRWVVDRYSFEHDAAGKVIALTGIMSDITEHKHAEWQREQAEERFRQLAENIREVFWLTDPQKSAMLYVSPAYEAIWGRPTASLYASPRNWLEAIHPDDRANVEAALYLQETGNYDEKYRIVRPDGGVRWIHDKAYPVRDTHGAVYRIAGVAEDITDQIKLEGQLRQSQKMEAVGQLSGGIAHDFNNRLTVIMGNLQLLQRKLKDDPAAAAMIDSALSASGGAADLTRRLLAFSRQQVLEPAVLDVNTLITGMQDLLAKTLGETVEIVTLPGPALWPVQTDPHLLENAVLNLAINARDAMPKGGTLTLETANIKLGEDYVAAHPYTVPGEYVFIGISDTGQGMNEEIKRRVFEPFFTTKPQGKGTGLGLSMVYGFVKQAGGHIEVYSEEGHGTSFKIYLPRVFAGDEADAAPRKAGSGQTIRLTGKTILLVEDEPEVRAISSALLNELGCRLLIAENGPAALKIAAGHPDIDLLFTDMIMPGGLTGIELAAQLREQRPDLKVLYTSGYAPQAAANRLAIEHPNDAWLAKPYMPDDLLAAVCKALVAN